MKELDRQIIEMYQSNVKVSDICRQLGTHTQRVYKTLRENNISEKKRYRFTPETQERMLEMLRSGMSSLEVAKEFGCDRGVVQRLMQKNNIPLQVGRPWHRRRIKPAESETAGQQQPAAQTNRSAAEMPEDLRRLVMDPENRTYFACFHKSKKQVSTAAEAVSFLYSVMSRRFTLSPEDVRNIEDSFRQLQESDKPRQAIVCPLSINDNLRFKISLDPEVSERYGEFYRWKDARILDEVKKDWNSFNPGMYNFYIPVGVYSENGDAVKYYDFKGTIQAECKEQAYDRAMDKLKSETGEERFNSLKIPGKYSEKVKFNIEPMA